MLLPGFDSFGIERSIGTSFRNLLLNNVMLEEWPSVIVTAISNPIFVTWDTIFFQME